jgi:2-oxoisovalerate dehydrogenase E1 component
MCVELADKFSDQGKASLEVLDLRSLSPLDTDAILKTVRKTGKVLVVHEDKVFGGFGGEIAAQITDLAFEYLDGPVRRVGSTFTPVGFNRILEAAILPDLKRIELAAEDLLNY